MRKILIFALLLTSAGKVFAQEEKHLFQYNEDLDYYYGLPLDYNEAGIVAKQYPLVVYLHGGGGYGKIDGLDYLGSSDNTFQSKYPSFVLVLQSKRGWDPHTFVPVVEKFKTTYPVDSTRIYLIGYSMGGSGSYIFANGYYDYNQTLFAAIIRLAGQSQTILRDPIALNTSVWLHIGLDDTPQRVDITREAYGFLKGKHPDASESVEDIDINGIRGTTFSLDGKESPDVKRTEYNGVGHGISRFPFDDKRLLLWLFDQHLE